MRNLIFRNDISVFYETRKVFNIELNYETGTFNILIILSLILGLIIYLITLIIRAMKAKKELQKIIDKSKEQEDLLKQANESLKETIQKEYSQIENLEGIVSSRTIELRRKDKELERQNDDIVNMLSDVVEMRDNESGEHIIRVKCFTKILSEQVKNDLKEYGLTDQDVNMFTSASALHDVGKIMIPDSVLLKPGKLTDEEYQLMKKHSEYGCGILKRTPKAFNEKYLQISDDICRYHHEKWDGKGYPYGLKGDEIPICAQIVSIADCYDALTTKRVYKDAYTPEKAFSMILNGECGAFSEKLLSCFEKCKEQFALCALSPEKYLEETINTENSGSIIQDQKILLIDNNKVDLVLNAAILEEENAIIHPMSNSHDALELFKNDSTYDLILIDDGLEDIHCVELIQKIRTMENGSNVLIVVMSDPENIQLDDYLKAGVDAYISNPIDTSELTKIILACMYDRPGSLDKQLNAVIKVANTDPLTKMRSYASYADRINRLNQEILNNVNLKFAIVLCDINNLKRINDTFGHDVGDLTIINSSRLLSKVFIYSPVYRTGEDEFIVILQGNDYDNRLDRMNQLNILREQSNLIDSYENGKTDFALGFALYDNINDKNVRDVIDKANQVMQKEKREK